jgi:AP2-like factor, ANT lineage
MQYRRALGNDNPNHAPCAVKLIVVHIPSYVGTEEEAAEAYDIAAIKFRGLNAVTNFDMSRYDVKSILESSTLPVGGAARRLKDAVDHVEAGATIWRADMDGAVISQLAEAGMGGYASYGHHGWPTIAFQQPSPLSVHYPYGQPSRGWCKPEQDAAAAAAHSLQDLQQLHLGSAAHNFFQASSSSTVYNGGAGASGGYQGLGGGSSFLMPSSTVVAAADQGHSSTANQGSTCSYGDDHQEGKLIGYDAAMVATAAGGDPYAAARNGYQFSQGSGSTVSIARANGYANNWSSPFNNGMG